MQAVRTPVLGIALAVLLLLGETVGMRAYVGPRVVSAKAVLAHVDPVEQVILEVANGLEQLRLEVVRLRQELVALRDAPRSDNARAAIAERLREIEQRLQFEHGHGKRTR